MYVPGLMSQDDSTLETGADFCHARAGGLLGDGGRWNHSDGGDGPEPFLLLDAAET